MEKIIDLIEKNIVIVAHEFNLATMNSIWFYKNNIFSEDELKGNISTPLLFEVHSKEFMFRIDPQRIQFSIFSKTEKLEEMMLSKINKIINLIPNSPFSAIGFNFTYHYYSKEQDAGQLSKELFYFKDSKLAQEFNTDDARFGAYFSKNIDEFRLKLDIKPVPLTQKSIRDERIQFSFNFHKAINVNENYNTILVFLKKWKETKQKADSIMKKIK